MYAAGSLLIFLAAFGVGASAWAVWQGGLPNVLEERPRQLDGRAASSRPQGGETTRLYTTSSGDPADAGIFEGTASGSTDNTEKADPDEPPVQAAFVHRATDENSRGDYTYLDNPSINGDPNATVFAVPASGREDAQDGTYNHNIGVWYEFVDRKRWAIFNQDRAPVPAGSTFEVVVPRETQSFVHHATQENTFENATYIDDPLTYGEPEVVVSVTQSWNPGGGIGIYNDHPVENRYDAGRGRWVIANKDLAPIKEGVSFNVSVSGQ